MGRFWNGIRKCDFLIPSFPSFRYQLHNLGVADTLANLEDYVAKCSTKLCLLKWLN